MQSVVLVETLTQAARSSPRQGRQLIAISARATKIPPLAIALAGPGRVVLTSVTVLRPGRGAATGRITAMTEAHLDRRQALQAFAALGLASAFAPRFAWAQDKKLLRVRSYSDLQVLDPLDRLSAPEDDITTCCLNRLIRRKSGETWAWEPDAAASIEQVDDTHIKFTLRPGLLWSGGNGEITAEDVK